MCSPPSRQVHAASAQIGVAVANRLPQFAINGDAGGNATQFSQMFWGSGTFWSVIGSVSQSIFDGGTLRHRQRAAEQGLVQAAAQYRITVLTAFQNVADSLHALYADADSLQAAVAAEQAASETLALTQKQLQSGYVSYLRCERAAGLSAGRAHAHSGTGEPARRYRSVVSGARRRLVEQGRRLAPPFYRGAGCRTVDQPCSFLRNLSWQSPQLFPTASDRLQGRGLVAAGDSGLERIDRRHLTIHGVLKPRRIAPYFRLGGRILYIHFAGVFLEHIAEHGAQHLESAPPLASPRPHHTAPCVAWLRLA